VVDLWGEGDGDSIVVYLPYKVGFDDFIKGRNIMSDKPKALGYIRNLTDGSMVHLVYPGAQLSFAFPIGHVYEMVADGDVPFKEFKEDDLASLLPEKETSVESAV